MGGLETRTDGGTHVGQPDPSGPQYAPANQAGTAAQQSHLDSFFSGTTWTREDVSLMLDVFILLIMLYWAYVEVGN